MITSILVYKYNYSVTEGCTFAREKRLNKEAAPTFTSDTFQTCLIRRLCFNYDECTNARQRV